MCQRRLKKSKQGIDYLPAGSDELNQTKPSGVKLNLSNSKLATSYSRNGGGGGNGAVLSLGDQKDPPPTEAEV